MAMDRRDALKLLTGGAAVAVGASMIESSTAFAADGGTASFRPTCATTSVVAYSATPNNRLTITVTPAAISCPSVGWTPSTSASFRVTNGFEVRSGPNTTQIATSNNFSAFQTLTVATSFQVNRGSNTDITDASSITVDVVVRRVCTNDSNNTRKAYCCTQFTRTQNYTRSSGGGTNDLWGSTSGNFAVGVTGASATGCAAP